MKIVVTLSSPAEQAVRNEATTRGVSVEALIRELVERTYPATKPVAEKRPFGLAIGAFSVPADFDAPLPNEVLALFEDK